MRSPGFLAPQVVTASVCGIMSTEKSRPATVLTVSDVPSSVTDPLTAMNFSTPAGARSAKRAVAPHGAAASAA